MVIAVEGMDGAGKTTVCEYVSRTKDFKMIEKPTKYFFQNEKGEINQELYSTILEEIYNASEFVRTTFFGLGNILATKKYANQNVILDRHLVSNYYWNSNEDYEEIYRLLVEQCKPDLTIFLYATPETRYNRLYKRNKKDVDLLDPSVFEDGSEKMTYFLNKYGLDYIFLDTDKKSIEEVYSEIDKIIDSFTIRVEKENELEKSNRK